MCNAKPNYRSCYEFPRRLVSLCDAVVVIVSYVTKHVNVTTTEDVTFDTGRSSRVFF
jgi:hypothetical protein